MGLSRLHLFSSMAGRGIYPNLSSTFSLSCWALLILSRGLDWHALNFLARTFDAFLTLIIWDNYIRECRYNLEI